MWPAHWLRPLAAALDIAGDGLQSAGTMNSKGSPSRVLVKQDGVLALIGPDSHEIASSD